MNKLIFTLLASLLIVPSSLAGVDITDFLTEKEEYKLAPTEIRYFISGENVKQESLPPLSESYVGKKCHPGFGEKCWFILNVENYSSITPYMRFYSRTTQNFNMYYSSQETLLESWRYKGFGIYHYEAFENVKGVKLDGLIERNYTFYFEYPEGKSIDFTVSFMPRYVIERKEIWASVAYYASFMIIIATIFSYSLLKRKGGLKNIALLLAYLSLFTYSSGFYFFSIFDSHTSKTINTPKFSIEELRVFVYLFSYLIVFEISNSYFRSPANYKLFTRVSLFIAFVFLFICVALEAPANTSSYFNLIVITLLTVTGVITKNMSKVFAGLLTLMVLTLMILSYLGANNSTVMGMGFDDWAVFLIVISAFPLYLLIDDLKKSKVISVGQYNLLLNDSKIDFMTGVGNVKLLADNVEKYSDKHFYYIDCVNLKRVNMVGGHNVGDRKLIELCDYFKKRRTSNNRIEIYRVAGDEFVIVSQLKIDDVIFDAKSNMSSDGSLPLNIRFGYAYCSQLGSADETLRKSEFACRTAKKNNLTNVSWNDDETIGLYCLPSYKDKAHELFNTENIVCFAQKIIAVDEKNPNKIELLCRLKDLNGNIHPAFRVLDITLAHGFEELLDSVMLDHAELALDLISAPDIVSLNVCPQSLLSESYLSRVIELSNKYPSRFMVEITEHSFYEDSDEFLSVITKMKDHGVIIALDDFGAGYSSYGILSSDYFDELKIDGALIKKVNDDFTGKLVRSISELCHSSNCKVTAEFVEDSELLTTLKDMQIDYLQGYYIHKPEALLDYVNRVYQP